MKKFLPKTINNPQGFTLIELLVVISIIAILSVIGMTVFGNLQKTARDAKRRADIEAIGKAMELNYSDTAGSYSVLSGNDFTSGAIPDDPLDSQTKCGTGAAKVCRYCVTTATGEDAGTTDCSTAGNKVSTTKPAAAATAYVICANLESSPYYVCTKNQRD